MTYWKLNEDPFYDDDGVLVDEDGWTTIDTSIPEDEKQELKRQAPEACYVMDCDPYSTINS